MKKYRRIRMLACAVLAGAMLFTEPAGSITAWAGNTQETVDDVQEEKAWKQAKEAYDSLFADHAVTATVYLADECEVMTQPYSYSLTVAKVPSGQQVFMQSLEKGADGYIWAKISFSERGMMQEGYIRKANLICTEDNYRQLERTYSDICRDEAGEDEETELLNAAKYQDVAQFPASYRKALTALKDKHKNWVFVPMNTGLDWDYVVKNESVRGRNLIPSSFPSYMKDGVTGQAAWSYISQGALKFYLDPRNWINETYIFQFEQLTYHSSFHTIQAVQKILDKTFMKGQIPEDSISYAQAFVRIGQQLGTSPFHLACRVYQEQGAGTSPLISGKYPGYQGYYNYFNIGASGSTNKDVIENGLKTARIKGWDTRYKSLLGGAEVISSSYILKGQDTLYLEKYDVDNSANGLFWHQYMQNVCAPGSEGMNIRKAYQEAGALENSFVFKIPVYQNMPANPCPMPTDLTKPAKPVLLKAEGIDYNQIKVTWKEVPEASGYYILRKEANGKFKKVGTVTDGNITYYTDGTAKLGKTYYYSVQAYRTGGEKTLTSDYSTKGKKAQAKLKAPKLKRAEILGNKIQITWEKVNGAHGYVIYRRQGTNKWKEIKTLGGGSKVMYTDRNVKSSAQYNYKVVAYRKMQGKKLYGAEDKNGMRALTVPKVDKLSVKREQTGYLKLTWKTSGTYDGCDIYRQEKKGKWIKIATLSGSVKNYTDKKLKDGMEYSYKIRPFAKDNKKTVKGSYSEVVSSQPLLDIPEMIGAEIEQDSYIKVSWEEVANVDGYIVYRKELLGGKWKKLATVKKETEYVDKDVLPQVLYSYTVTSYIRSGNTIVESDRDDVGVSGQLK